MPQTLCTAAPHALGVPLAMSGCTIVETSDADDASSTRSPDEASSTTGTVTTASASGASSSLSTSATSSTGAPSTTTSRDESSAGGCWSLGCDPDAAGVPSCIVWDDERPRGEKCTFWSGPGGAGFEATRDVPVVDDPAGPGEPCLPEIDIGSGFDDREAGSTCWPFGDAFRCRSICNGTPNAPLCDDPNAHCTVSGDSIATICSPSCDPLDPASSPDGSRCDPSAPDCLTCVPHNAGTQDPPVLDGCSLEGAST
ncbi:MAG: hypothetical protein AAGA54_15765 [Myxococcota bacterium]